MPPSQGEYDREHHVAELGKMVSERPGCVAYVRLTGFQQTLVSVFRRNLEELIALLQRAATDFPWASELIQNAHRPDIQNEFQAELAQRLHNYTAGTMTLVDHSRRLLRDRTDAVATEFKSRKAAVLAEPVVPFVQDLRNHTLHRSPPPATISR